MATPEDHKAAIRLVYDVEFSRNNIDIIDEVFDERYVVRFPGISPIEGRAAAKEAIGHFLEAFPAKYHVEDIIAEGDKVAARWVARGTHQGDFHGIPDIGHVYKATGKPVTFGATDIYRFVDGKVVEEWNTIEQWDLLVQIGAMSPDPARAV